VELLTAELAKATQATKIYPGTQDLLTALEPYEADGRALVGLLTGNVQHGAALKLRSAGLDFDRFAVGAFGSDSHYRPHLPAIAARRAEHRTGRTFTGADIVIVGDTPDDVACARPMGARTVGVGTGHYSAAQLKAAGATHAFDTLGETAAVIQALFA
jgi:phosphoglycolate phosphatase-like HAD superfamily hydrolase